MRKLSGILAVAGLLAVAGTARAVSVGNPVDVEVWAQINNTLQLTVVSATSYDFGTIGAGTQNVSATTFDIDNTGSGLTETLNLTAAVTGGWTLAPQGSGPALDQVALYSQFNFPAAPTPAALFVANMQVDGTVQASSAVKYAGNASGLSTTTGQRSHMWVGLAAPTSTTVSNRQNVKITVSATTP